MQDRTEPLSYKPDTIKPAASSEAVLGSADIDMEISPGTVSGGFTRAAVQAQWSLVVLE